MSKDILTDLDLLDAGEAPKQIAVLFCRRCSDVTYASSVNRLDEVRRWVCPTCDSPIGVLLYRFERAVG